MTETATGSTSLLKGTNNSINNISITGTINNSVTPLHSVITSNRDAHYLFNKKNNKNCNSGNDNSIATKLFNSLNDNSLECLNWNPFIFAGYLKQQQKQTNYIKKDTQDKNKHFYLNQNHHLYPPTSTTMEDAEVEEIMTSTKEMLPNNILDHYSNVMTATSSQYHPMMMMKMMMMNMANSEGTNTKLLDELPNQTSIFGLPSIFGSNLPQISGSQEYSNSLMTPSSPLSMLSHSHYSTSISQQQQQQQLQQQQQPQQHLPIIEKVQEQCSQNVSPTKQSSRNRSNGGRNRQKSVATATATANTVAINTNETNVADSTSVDPTPSSERTISENPMYRCHLCPYTGNSKQHFNVHMNSHFEHKCPHCDYTSRTEGRLKRHIRDFHSESPPETWGGTGLSDSDLALFEPIEEIDELAGPNPVRNRKYRCKQCNYVATEKHEYWEHTKNHIKTDKMLACPKCNFVTEFKHHLVYHLRNHFGSKPFKCGKCNYSCVNKSMLNSHMKSHSNIYQYRCEDCTYATKYCHSLKLHLRKYNHKPATVLNLDGTPNPYPVIDVYGTRRGPRPKKGHKGSGLEDQEELEPLKQYAMVAQADCDLQLPTTSASMDTSASGNLADANANSNALKCDYCTFQTESKPDFAQHLLKHVITEKQILIKNKKKSVNSVKKFDHTKSEDDTLIEEEDNKETIEHKLEIKKSIPTQVLPTTTTPPPTPNNHHQSQHQSLNLQAHSLDQSIKVETKFFASPNSSLAPSELTSPILMEDVSAFAALHSPAESISNQPSSSSSSSMLFHHAPLDLSSKPESPELESSIPQSSEQLSALLLMNILQQQQQQQHEDEQNQNEQTIQSCSENILGNTSSQLLNEEFIKISTNNLTEYLEQQQNQQQQSSQASQIVHLANLFLPILQMNPTLNPIVLFQQFLPQLLTSENSSVESVVALLQKMHNATSLMQEILLEMCAIKHK